MTAPDKRNPIGLGHSVSQSGNILVVSREIFSDPGGVNAAGAAYLYELNSNGSATYPKLTAPDKMADDNFGWSVSHSGNVLAVGAFYHPDGVTQAGVVYLYQLEANGSAAYLSKVTASDKASSDQFGYSVSLSGDILAVGARSADPNGVSDAGAAYLYQLGANGSVTYLTKITAPDKAASDNFGWSVSQFGNLFVVGASKSDPDGVSDAGPFIFMNWTRMDRRPI